MNKNLRPFELNYLLFGLFESYSIQKCISSSFYSKQGSIYANSDWLIESLKQYM